MKIWLRPMVMTSISASRAKEGRPGLARFEQVVDTVAVACLVPVALVGEHRAVENLLQLLDLFVGENILFGLAARAFVAVGNLGI